MRLYIPNTWHGIASRGEFMASELHLVQEFLLTFQAFLFLPDPFGQSLVVLFEFTIFAHILNCS